MPRIKLFAALTVAVLVVGSAGVANAAANPKPSFWLLVSNQADRSNAVALSGAKVRGNIAIFAGQRGNSPATITFYLDDPWLTQPYSTETLQPFDFAGTDDNTGTAKTFNASTLTPGRHQIIAVRTAKSGKQSIIRARFEVIAPPSAATASPGVAAVTSATLPPAPASAMAIGGTVNEITSAGFVAHSKQ